MCTRQIVEQSPPPHFSLQVVCKKGGVFSGAYSMYFGTCNRISMKLAFFLPVLPWQQKCAVSVYTVIWMHAHSNFPRGTLSLKYSWLKYVWLLRTVHGNQNMLCQYSQSFGYMPNNFPRGTLNLKYSWLLHTYLCLCQSLWYWCINVSLSPSPGQLGP